MESFEIFITLNMGILCCQQESKKQVPNIINVVNEPEKALLFIAVTLDGIYMDFKFEQQ